jgi:ABC-type lipoprotein export system ATPase subunit
VPETSLETSLESADVVCLTGLGRRFPTDPPVDALTNVSLRVEEGEWVAIVGPSGSGKSTLLNIIGCLDTPTSGSYRFDGIEVAGLSDRQRSGLRSSGIGFVFQEFRLLAHRTVLENVLLADVYRQTQTQTQTRERRGHAIAALDRVGLSHRAGFLPSQLSGGERQRVAIARALLGAPRLLLCDEPTGNLDTSNARTVLALFGELHKSGNTIVMITHDLAVAGVAGRRVNITDGVLTEVTA